MTVQIESKLLGAVRLQIAFHADQPLQASTPETITVTLIFIRLEKLAYAGQLELEQHIGSCGAYVSNVSLHLDQSGFQIGDLLHLALGDRSQLIELFIRNAVAGVDFDGEWWKKMTSFRIKFSFKFSRYVVDVSPTPLLLQERLTILLSAAASRRQIQIKQLNDNFSILSDQNVLGFIGDQTVE